VVFGYTFLDPLVVVCGTVLALWLLASKPVRLVAYLPTALSIYFIIPAITLLTLWQTVPLLLTARLAILGKVRIFGGAQPFFVVIFGAFLISAIYAVAVGEDRIRAVIRIIYYLGVFSLFLFCYEMGRKPESYRLLLKGFVVVGAVYAIYGLYQIIAMKLGLPVRGILRGTYGADMAYEYGVVRINSLANEPKRLGYLMFLSALACLFLARIEPWKARSLKLWAVFIFILSLFTFSGSFFLAVALFIIIASLLYPTWATKYLVFSLSIFSVIIILFPDMGLTEAISHGFERRLDEVEVGLDGARVYRQEFFAWDYLSSHPFASIFGVGLGQYFSTLYQEYGSGVGISGYGTLVPMNSNFLEILFDLSGIVAIFFYVSMSLLIWRLRQGGEMFFCLGLLFLLIQSFSILTLHLMVVFAGLGLAQLARHSSRQGRKTIDLLDLA